MAAVGRNNRRQLLDMSGLRIDEFGFQPQRIKAIANFFSKVGASPLFTLASDAVSVLPSLCYLPKPRAIFGLAVPYEDMAKTDHRLFENWRLEDLEALPIRYPLARQIDMLVRSIRFGLFLCVASNDGAVQCRCLPASIRGCRTYWSRPFCKTAAPTMMCTWIGGARLGSFLPSTACSSSITAPTAIRHSGER